MNRTTPVLYLHPWASQYGADNCLYLLIKHVNREVFRPVVVLAEDGPLGERLQDQGVPVVRSPLRTWFTHDDSMTEALRWAADLPERVQRIVELTRECDIKIIYSNVENIFEGALAARLTGRPHICTVRATLSRWTWRKTFLPLDRGMAVLAALSQAVVADSDAAAQDLAPWVPPEKLRTIYGAVETRPLREPLSPDSTSSAPALKEPAPRPRVLSLGRVAVQKGYELLIESAARVLKTLPDVQFVVCGQIQDESYYRQLLERSRRLGLGDNLRFIGHSDRPQQELEAADLLVVSSKGEGLSQAVLEAMAAGKPVVSTRCGGPEDAIVDGTTGLLVSPEDPGALAQAILAVLGDPERARQMGHQGWERVRRHFDILSTAEKYEALYTEVLEAARVEPPEETSGEAEFIHAALDTVGSYGTDVFEIWRQYQELSRFEARVKGSRAYRLYRATRDRMRKFT